MNKKHLAELLKYSSPKHLYVVTWNKVLKLLVCPFRVQVKYGIGDLKENTIVWVDEVKISQELKTVFIIRGKAYHYFHFNIQVN